jgi:ATP synthase in type III secretion protein N
LLIGTSNLYKILLKLIQMKSDLEFLDKPWRLQTPLALQCGFVKHAVGTIVRATGISAAIGEVCILRGDRGRKDRSAEVVGIAENGLLLMPFGGLEGICIDDTVIPTGNALRVPVGDALKGRIIDALGQPIDGGADIDFSNSVPLGKSSPSPMRRQRIDRVFSTGVRAIDALITVGLGQRIGIFAPAGVGKSVLMAMLARNSESDVNVIALIGERGREVREFVEDSLGTEGLKRSIVVVATADAGPIERSKAAFVATGIAEHFRDEGKRVLLLVDSVTRFARAQREIGLARGEPPTRRGFPPSLFAALPQLFERAGCSERGSITAFYTVLMEDESSPDPVAEEVRSLLDGHIVLSRKLAGLGIYPAIDPIDSLSRLMSHITTKAHGSASVKARSILSRRADVDLLVKVGEYKRGTDLETDDAIDRAASVEKLICQSPTERVLFASAIKELSNVTGVPIV